MLTIGDFVQFNSRFYEPRNVEAMCIPKYPNSMAYMVFGEVLNIDDSDDYVLIRVKNHLYSVNYINMSFWIEKDLVEKIDFSMANQYMKRQERNSLSAKYHLERRDV